jgi:hypothetical protein
VPIKLVGGRAGILPALPPPRLSVSREVEAVQRQEPLTWASKKGLARLLSSFKPDRTQEVVECCLRELVRYYRHSGVGRNCCGIVHQMNTPLQVLSF